MLLVLLVLLVLVLARLVAVEKLVREQLQLLLAQLIQLGTQSSRFLFGKQQRPTGVAHNLAGLGHFLWRANEHMSLLLLLLLLLWLRLSLLLLLLVLLERKHRWKAPNRQLQAGWRQGCGHGGL